MRKQEQRLWDTMKRNAPRDVWLERVENIVGEGMPDVAVRALPNRQSWVELKACRRPARSTTALKPGLRQSQINWHLKAASLRVPSFVLVRDHMQGLYLCHGRDAEELDVWTLAEHRARSLAEDWAGIFKVTLT